MNYKNVSALQRYIWLDQLMDSSSSKYNVGGYSEIRGFINKDKFKKAVQVLLDTSDIFSFKFEEIEGVPYYFTKSG